MNNLIRSLACLSLLAALSSASHAQVIRPLAQEHLELARSQDPLKTAAYSPGLTRLSNGRLVATYNLGKGFIQTSDDHGKTWRMRGEFNMSHARPFEAGGSVYVLGQKGDLAVMRSTDGGETWSEQVKLTDGQKWHQAPCNVHYAGDKVYLVMERVDKPEGFDAWPVRHVAPVLMRASVYDDLTKRESWTFASELFFRDAVDVDDVRYAGIPFYGYDPMKRVAYAKRNFSPPGWLETNVVQFVDPEHLWYDPAGRTFHLYMRANTGMSNLGAIAKVVENDDGTITTMLEKAPSGKEMVFLQLPGGQMKFHILYDEQTKLYWLLSTQAIDTMTKPEALSAERFGLADNERQRLVLHFSKNAVDWCFAGVVAIGDSPKQSRHYASMTIDGDDLHVLSRSGDADAKSAHDGNLITFHTVKNFRELVY